MTDPIDTARRHVALAADFLGLSPAQARALAAAHDTDIRRTAEGEGISYTNGATDVASWLRSVDQDRPSLVGKAPAASAPLRTDRDWSRETATAIWTAAALGDETAKAHITRPHGGGIASTDRPTVTALMMRARQGDASAQRDLDARMKEDLSR